MKKSVLLLVVAVFTFTQLVAQDPIFVKGDRVLNIGLGTWWIKSIFGIWL